MYDFINEMPYIILLSIPISFGTYMLFPKTWKKRLNLFFYIVFICYLLCVFLITIPPFFSFGSIDIQELLHFVNIIPLSNNQGGFLSSRDFSQCIMNAIMFVPLGVLLPLTLKRRIRIRYFIFICFGFSLTIEVIQLIGTYSGLLLRSFDVNDILFNTIGGTFTYGFASFIFECLQKYHYIEKEQAHSLS